MPTPLVLAWSGGNDSAMAFDPLRQNPDFEVAALLTTVTEGFERISMHGVRRELLRLQADSIGLPLAEVRIPPRCPNSLYESRMAEASLRFRARGVRHIALGDIFLRDLREYREKSLAQLEMLALFPLWDIDTSQLAERFISDGFRAVTSRLIQRSSTIRLRAGNSMPASFETCRRVLTLAVKMVSSTHSFLMDLSSALLSGSARPRLWSATLLSSMI